MSLFKKKDEDRKEAYKPSDDNVSAKEGSSGGKGGGEPAAPSVDPTTKSGKAAIKKSMDDGRFGYGYIDRNTGVEVPWYIDMINGGGANAAGDTFVSPFADLPFGGGMASMPSNLANAAGIAPYGYNQPRRYAQAGMQGYPAAAPAPTGGGVGGGSATVTPVVDNSQYGDAGFYDGMEVNRPVKPRTSDQAIGGYQYPSMYRSMDSQVSGLQQAQSSVSPAVPQGGALQPMPAKSLMDRYLPASMDMGQVSTGSLPSMASLGTDSAGNRPSEIAMTPPSQAPIVFQQQMNTVPEMFRGTEIEQMYRDYLLGGNMGTFGQFTGAQR